MKMSEIFAGIAIVGLIVVGVLGLVAINYLGVQAVIAVFSDGEDILWLFVTFLAFIADMAIGAAFCAWMGK